MIENCPECHRKLISHSSPRCNWCGCEIQNPAYQEEAEVRRQAHALEQAQHDAQSRLWYQTNGSSYDMAGRPSRMPVSMEQEIQQRMAAEAALRAAAYVRKQQDAADRAWLEQEAAAHALREAAAEAQRQARELEAAHQSTTNRFSHLEL